MVVPVSRKRESKGVRDFQNSPFARTRLWFGWDIILFDSPPLVAVTDATMISKEIDKIIVVVKVGQTDKKAFEHTINSLKNVGSPIGGVVLNAVDNKNSYGSYYYYYQYYNYYGSDSKKK